MPASVAASRARTVAAHVLNSSAAAPWIIGVASEPTAGGAGPTLVFGREFGQLVVVAHPEEPPAVGAHVVAELAGTVGGVQVRDRGGVGPLHPRQCLPGRARSLTVHRGQHGDLGDVAGDAQGPGHGRVEVVGSGRLGEGLVA